MITILIYVLSLPIILFFFFRNPLTIRIILLVFSFLVFWAFTLFSFKWFRISLILIFSGGVIVLILFLVAIRDHNKIIQLNIKRIFFLLRPLLLYPFMSFVQTSKKLELTYFFSDSNLLGITYLCFYLLILLTFRVRVISSSKRRLIKKL